MPYYSNPANSAITLVSTLGDGYSMEVRWHQAYPDNITNKIAYNIYYSTIEEDVFAEGPKFVVFDGSLKVDLYDFTPGQLYHFGVRAIEYDPNVVDPTTLPIVFPGVAIYPESLLSQDITSTQTTIPLLDVATFPPYGIIKVGVELIQYLAVDHVNNDLIVPGSTGGEPAHLVDFGPPDGYYERASTNVGDGYINNLALVSGALTTTEDWTIKCVFVQQDSMGNPVPNSAQFIAIGSLTGVLRDGYQNPITWTANNIVVSSSVLSFSVQEGLIPFVDGDYFTARVIGNEDPVLVGRGFYGTEARMHNTDGYDGYFTWSPIVSFILSDSEELNDKIRPSQSHFEFFQDHYTIPDGYYQITKDILTTDLRASDQTNSAFANDLTDPLANTTGYSSYDYAGWHRRDPTLLLNGECVGSYIGGQQFCADGYDGVGRVLRGISIQERNDQRQEILLNLTGEPVILVKRQWTGIVCKCVMASGEYPDDRCLDCFGGKYILNWNQYFNEKRDDGKIMVRFSPVDDKVVQYDSGLESEMTSDCWSLVVPTIKHRDIIVRFEQDGTEEFRYEVINVNRNRMINQLSGAQHFRVQRIRKSDIAYQIPILRNMQHFPQVITTGITSIPGLAPHMHELVISENFQNGAAQLTSVAQGHNHQIVFDKTSGKFVVSTVLGHSHTIIYNYTNNGSYIFR